MNINELKKDEDGWSEYTTKEQVTERATEAVTSKISFKEMYNNRINPNIKKTYEGKGQIGQLVEECWFNIPNNSRPEPDFPIPGIELKVTGYTKSNGQMKAKERLVFNKISYEEEAGKSYEESSFIKKNKLLELMCYEYHKDQEQYPLDNWYISHETLLDLSTLGDVDLEIIKRDYNIINNKITEGKAHELSEGDTMYLAANVKGVNGQQLVKQPYNSIPAKPRAYSFKPSYLNVIFRKEFPSEYEEQEEQLIRSAKEIKEQSFEEIVENKIKNYIGKSRNDLIKEFNLNPGSKEINYDLISRMLGVKDINRTDEFKKAGILVKTVTKEFNNKIKESMSFKNFDPIEIENQEWEDSTFYNELTSKFMFVVYKKDILGNVNFKGIKFFGMPEDDLDEAKKVWEKTKELLSTNTLVVTKKNGKNTNNLPKKNENRVSHVRPKAANAAHTFITTHGVELTKQCFWLNNTYIAEILKAI